jgi:pimeloyl-ACP methyl ester carboxylesterase
MGFDYSLLPLLKDTDFDADKLNGDPKVTNSADLYECDRWLYDTYDNSVILDILNNFLPNFEKPVLLVYAQDDPWTGSRITNINPVAKLIMNPDGVHKQDINNADHYSPAIRQEIIDYIAKYVKIQK